MITENEENIKKREKDRKEQKRILELKKEERKKKEQGIERVCFVCKISKNLHCDYFKKRRSKGNNATCKTCLEKYCRLFQAVSAEVVALVHSEYAHYRDLRGLPKVRHEWTKREDNLIIRAVSEHGKKWLLITKNIRGLFQAHLLCASTFGL